MATSLHLRVRDCLDAALLQPPERRRQFLLDAVGEGTVLDEALALLPYYADAARSTTGGGQRAEAWLPGPTTLERVLAPACEVPEPKPPFAISPYAVVEIIGRGGMGVVYRAVDPLRNCEVAIKLLRGRLNSPQDCWNFKHEEELLRQLRHPGIVRMLHGGAAHTTHGPETANTLTERPYFVMEYVRGQSLLQYAVEHSLDSLQRLALFIEICAAVEYAHQRGVIHRDLKPDNILVDGDGQPKILDFGIARLQALEPAAAETERRFAGTLAYASPEQLAGEDATLTPASDVFTIGLILHELLTGVLPRRAGTRLTVDLRTVALPGKPARVAPLEPEFRFALQAVILTALRKTTGHRYAHAGEVAADLRAIHEAHAPRRGWLEWISGFASAFRPAATTATATHERLLAVRLRRRIGSAMVNERPHAER